MCSPMFSIIMPAYNAYSTLGASVESVLKQDFDDFELIIVDDCSLDGTLELANVFKEADDRVQVIRLRENVGVAGARNFGISSCRGRYIAFLDADDLWLPEKLSRQKVLFDGGALVVFSEYVRFFPDGKENSVRVPTRISYEELLTGNVIGNLTGAYDAIALGKFYQKNIGHEDYLMWLKIVEKAGVAQAVLLPLARYRVGENSISANKFKSAVWTWNIYRSLNFNFLRTSCLFVSYFLKALKKRI